MNEQTGLSPLRRRLLAGMGVLGATLFTPWMRRSRAASPQGDGSSPNGGVAPRSADKPDDLPNAALYEEDQSDPKGKRFPGVALWTLVEQADDRSGMLETSVRASVAIPEWQLVMRFTFRLNKDKSLPASHTVE